MSLYPPSANTPIRLSWIKCGQGNWCNFLILNLNDSHFIVLRGVYVIWRGGENSATVYVGQGNISQRLLQHRDEQNILQYTRDGLFVTWARANDNQLDGIEAYLHSALRPLQGINYPRVTPIPVVLPW